MRRNSDLVPFVFTPAEISFRFTGLSTVNERAIELSTQNQREFHLIASIQRRIFQNFLFDIKLLAQVKFGKNKFSTAKFCVHMFGTLVKFLIRQTRASTIFKSDRWKK